MPSDGSTINDNRPLHWVRVMLNALEESIPLGVTDQERGALEDALVTSAGRLTDAERQQVDRLQFAEWVVELMVARRTTYMSRVVADYDWFEEHLLSRCMRKVRAIVNGTGASMTMHVLIVARIHRTARDAIRASTDMELNKRSCPGPTNTLPGHDTGCFCVYALDLPRSDRDIATFMRLHQGETVPVLAREQGVSEGAIRQQSHRGRLKLLDAWVWYSNQGGEK